MIHEELKQLESIYLQLNDAFYNEDEYKMKILFNEFINNFPQYIKSKDDNISDVFIEHGKIPGRPCSIFLIGGDTLRYNIEGCLRTIWAILESNKYQTFSSHCIEVLYFPQKAFTPTDIGPIQPELKSFSWNIELDILAPAIRRCAMLMCK